jgi:hypothetical protein
VADFGSFGIWQRRGTTWSQLHPYSAKALIRIRGRSQDGLVADFGPGLGVWYWERYANGDVFWVPMHHLSPAAMAGIDRDGDGDTETVVFDFTGYGLWLWDGDRNEWTLLHSANSLHLAVGNFDGDGGEELIVDFSGYGLWEYSSAGSWSEVHPHDATSMAVADLDGNGEQDVFATLPFGLMAYMNNTNWAPLHDGVKRMVGADLDGNGRSALVADFGPGIGVWVLRFVGGWRPLHHLTTENMVSGDLDGNGKDEVVIDFGAAGVWSFEDGRGWEPIHSVSPGAMVVGRFR